MNAYLATIDLYLHIVDNVGFMLQLFYFRIVREIRF